MDPIMLAMTEKQNNPYGQPRSQGETGFTYDQQQQYENTWRTAA